MAWVQSILLGNVPNLFSGCDLPMRWSTSGEATDKLAGRIRQSVEYQIRWGCRPLLLVFVVGCCGGGGGRGGSGDGGGIFSVFLRLLVFTFQGSAEYTGAPRIRPGGVGITARWRKNQDPPNGERENYARTRGCRSNTYTEWSITKRRKRTPRSRHELQRVRKTLIYPVKNLSWTLPCPASKHSRESRRDPLTVCQSLWRVLEVLWVKIWTLSLGITVLPAVPRDR